MPEREFVLPEFTRSLRALAMPTAGDAGADHDRIFAPLLQARTAAGKMQTLEAQLAAFDAARLERAWRDAIKTLAGARRLRTPADRRAFAAELDTLAAPLWQALHAMQSVASAARVAPTDDRHAAWERWVASVRRVFAAADAWWGDILPMLGDSRAGRPGFWRRLFRRGA